ncbi:hypothetical protein A2U01_0094519, partial [Trifolium medium]|nr:hypothetical protein [Trifolium medium]
SGGSGIWWSVNRGGGRWVGSLKRVEKRLRSEAIDGSAWEVISIEEETGLLWIGLNEKNWAKGSVAISFLS